MLRIPKHDAINYLCKHSDVLVTDILSQTDRKLEIEFSNCLKFTENSKEKYHFPVISEKSVIPSKHIEGIPLYICREAALFDDRYKTRPIPFEFSFMLEDDFVHWKQQEFLSYKLNIDIEDVQKMTNEEKNVFMKSLMWRQIRYPVAIYDNVIRDFRENDELVMWKSDLKKRVKN